MVEYVQFYYKHEDYPFFTICVNSSEDFYKTYVGEEGVELEILSEEEYKEYVEAN